MRILHTSDWHLGRSFGPLSLADDQGAFVDWLVERCQELTVDLVVVAGDIYDRAIPPTDAVVAFRNALRRLVATGAQVAVITGNHDGADRVASYDGLLDRSGVWLRGGYSRLGEVVRLSFADGPLDLVLLPFLDPQAAPDDLVDATTQDAASPDDETSDAVGRRVRRTHESVLTAAIDAASAHLSAPRSLAVAHAFVAGGSESESERQLTVGGTGQVPADLFDRFSYTALGHLHRPQTVGRPTVRYSGTPLAYSFSEEHAKSVCIVDMTPEGACTMEEMRIPVGRAVRTVTGTIDDLLAATPTAHEADAFVRAIVIDRDTVLDAKARLAEVYPHVVEVVLRPAGAAPTGEAAAPEIREMTPYDATLEFWRAAEGSDPDPDTAALLADVVGAAIERTTA